MTRFLFASLLASVIPITVAAETCALDKNYCVPFVGCAEDGTGFFYGVTFGKQRGPVYAVSETGARCVGKWWRGAFGVGKARFSCEDGKSGRARYTYFDKTTGTATGQVRLSSGADIRFWAGHNCLPHVLSDQTETKDMVACVSEAAKRAEARNK